MKINSLLLIFSGLAIIISFFPKNIYPQTSGPMASTVYSLAFSGPDILAGTESGIFKSTDNGNTWSQTSLYNQITQSICSNGKFIIANISFGGLYSSGDNGVTWVRLPEPKNFYMSGKLESVDSVFFAGTNKGLFTSEDNGQHWRWISLDSGIVKLVFSNGSTIFAGTKRFGDSPYGIYTSDNYGKDWKKLFDSQSDVKSITVSDSDIYVSTGQNGISRSTDFGMSWTKLAFEPICFHLCMSGSNIIAGTYKGLYISSDKGESWNCILPDKSILSLIANDSFVFCGTRKYGLYVSSDNGLNWIQTSLNNFEIKPEKFKKKQIKGQWDDFVIPLLMAGDMIEVTFSADSFYYHNSRFSDVYEKPCSPYIGDEYASGEFEIDDSQIYFNGNWTDKTYKNILTEDPCNTGKFELTYQYEYFSNHMLVLKLIKSARPYITGVKSSMYLYKK